jgi:hypothetical protein
VSSGYDSLAHGERSRMPGMKLAELLIGLLCRYFFIVSYSSLFICEALPRWSGTRRTRLGCHNPRFLNRRMPVQALCPEVTPSKTAVIARLTRPFHRPSSCLCLSMNHVDSSMAQYVSSFAFSTFYFTETAFEAEPPKLLRTVTFCGFVGHGSRALNLPPPLFVNVPINAPVAVT